MKVVNICYPCSCGAMISFILKLGNEKQKTFIIPCKGCDSKRRLSLVNYSVTLSEEFDKPSFLKKLTKFFRKKKTEDA